MNSLQERLESFINWPIESNTCIPKFLASVCFEHTNPEYTDLCVCVICKKNLENWDPEDIPVTEHYEHKQDCPIFNLSSADQRLETYKLVLKHKRINIKMARKLSDQGFFVYTIKKDSKYDLFCYVCGFYISDKCDLNDNLFLSHSAYCKLPEKSKDKTSKQNGKIFANNLFAGKYFDMLHTYMYSNLCIPDSIKEEIEKVVFAKDGNFISGKHMLENVNEALEKKYDEYYEIAEAMIDNEINVIMGKLDKKLVEYTNQLNKF
ncbi:hypothetical protein EDEG_02876 [Edhazardia aedis USNM 41457]|uniref:Uncharacterized protein n=1 Tax=Edhazardia aedis (strain USNM 41457) TaxID=1003232 RepID=J8ZST1_EDHAE|nr:hypothetical protein EDEG_02876 [Edhazardia aedis USNM 41457]|eukprot:EJW02723.1 hypothetical protein EDEG_02876 [Edhazardia aedis USNM 41457]